MPSSQKSVMIEVRVGYVKVNNNNTYNIRRVNLNCHSTKVVYLLTWKTCGVSVAVLLTLGLNFNNYKSCNNWHKSTIVPQQNLHNHFDLPDHSGISNFEFFLVHYEIFMLYLLQYLIALATFGDIPKEVLDVTFW